MIYVSEFWPLIATILVVLASIYGWKSTPSHDDATKIATYISGVTSAIAIIWLVAGFRTQTRELNLQRQELQLQRLAAQQQAKELSNSAKLGSLAQIRSLLEDAERCVRESPLNLSGPSDIQAVYFEKMDHWDVIENSPIPSRVTSAYREWLPAEAVARNYVRYIASALKIYIEHHYPQAKIDQSKDPEEFVYIYEIWGRKAPFISHHIGVAAMLAQLLWLMQPGLERMRLAWLVASSKAFGKTFLKEGALEELREEVLKRSSDLPKVCSPWPT